ncbi:MAG TPA: 30S ribosomal protein S16 [Chloroflexota bacterium]|nr:30S ribosomal protein S16 [Chloroflexota bacterium]
MRLTRIGAKKRPQYRVVVADSRAPRDGRHVDILGNYDPLTSPATINIDTQRAVKWLQNGAQPSERVRILLRHSGVLKEYEEQRMAAKRQLKEERAAAPARAPKPVRTAATTAQRIVTRVARTATDAAEAALDAVSDAAGAVVSAAAPVTSRSSKGGRTGTRSTATRTRAKK